jgi:hypothetical protein
LSNTTLEHVEKEKDIGVTIDSKLTFEHHMNEKINKTNSTMGLIGRTFTCLDEETLSKEVGSNVLIASLFG